MNVHEAAELLGVGRPRVGMLCKEGVLRAEKVIGPDGWCWDIDAASVEAEVARRAEAKEVAALRQTEKRVRQRSTKRVVVVPRQVERLCERGHLLGGTLNSATDGRCLVCERLDRRPEADAPAGRQGRRVKEGQRCAATGCKKPVLPVAATWDDPYCSNECYRLHTGTGWVNGVFRTDLSGGDLDDEADGPRAIPRVCSAHA